MIEKGKQLTLNQRNKIEEMLNPRRRKFEIANELDKTQSTIAIEINRHKILKPHNIYKSSNLFVWGIRVFLWQRTIRKV